MPPPPTYKQDDSSPFMQTYTADLIRGMVMLKQDNLNVRGHPQYNFAPDDRIIVRGATRFFEDGFGLEVPLSTASGTPADDEAMGECLEGLLHLRETRDLVVMNLNLHYFSQWPKDPDAGFHELVKITEVQPPPDIICVQEGLLGQDVLSELGYRRLASSQSSAQPLREALYHDATRLRSVKEAYHDHLVVNELYVRVQTHENPLEWEVVDHGAARISSDALTTASESGSMALAMRSVVWAKLRHRTHPSGPFVFLLNTQLTGGHGEETHFSHEALAYERRKQVERLLDFAQSRLESENDFGLFIGDLGASPSEGSKEFKSSPFGLLAERSWNLAYKQAQVGASNSAGHLVDHMATSRTVPALVKVFQTANQATRENSPVVQVPLSDHNVIKATFSLRFPINDVDKAVIRGEPQYPFGEDEAVGLLEQAQLDSQRRKNFPLSFRPDASDTSYVGMCARYEFECQDLMNERATEQEQMEEITASLTEQMWRMRDQCSDQSYGKSVLIQRIHEANDSVITMNETWAAARANLQAELEDERLQKEHLEAEFHSQEEEIQAQIEQCRRQLETMEEARRFLGRHRLSMSSIKDLMVNDIEVEKRMTAEISEVGDKHMIEWSEQQQEIHAELKEQLDAHQHERKIWQDEMNDELDAAKVKKREVDLEEAELKQRLQRSQEEMSQQAQELSSEVSEKSRELQELNARIDDVHKEFQTLEEQRPLCEEQVRYSIQSIADKQAEREECDEEIRALRQDWIRIRAHIDELKNSEKTAQGRPRPGDAHASEEITRLELQKSEYDVLIQRERRLKNELTDDLEMASQRSGLFSCLWPKSKSRGALKDRSASDKPGM